MSGRAFSDLSGLMSLAQQRDLDLRPVILRVQTDLFVTAPSRDRAMIEAFEALACGLLPTVDDETATLVALKLASLEETPERVLICLAIRGGEPLCAVLEGAARLPAAVLDIADAVAALDAAIVAGPAPMPLIFASDPELEDVATSGRDEPARPSGPSLDALIARARTDVALADALLRRDDLAATDLAPLYLQTDEARRRRLVAELETVAVLRMPMLPRAAAAKRGALVAAASAKDAVAFGRELAELLCLPGTPAWGFEDPARHDLLVLGLRAGGVPEEESIRILLTLEPTIALEVDEVLRLVRLFRGTPRETAAYVLEAVLGTPVGDKPAARHQPFADQSGTTRTAAVVARASEPPALRYIRRA